ncbi:MAG: LysE family translocator [Actinobacteria bacterium]|nr:LysE family translocator [Actinomycetota bacterium]
MPSVTTVVVFSAAALVLLVVPGPAVFYVVTRSASQGRRAGLVSVAGIHTGTVVHVLAAVAGLSAILVTSAAAFTVVKVAGAAYLIHLGVRSLLDYRRQRGSTVLKPLAPRSMRRIFLDAVVLNILNLKTAVFFLAFLPQFVHPAAGGTTVQLLVLGGVYIGLGVLSDTAYAFAGAWIGDRLHGIPVVARRTTLLAGTTYIGLGVATAASGSGSRS